MTSKAKLREWLGHTLMLLEAAQGHALRAQLQRHADWCADMLVAMDDRPLAVPPR